MIERFENCARQFTIGARIEAHRDVADSDMDRAAVAFIDREGPALGEPASLAIGSGHVSG